MSRPPADGPIEDWTVSAARRRAAQGRAATAITLARRGAAASTPPPPPAVDAADVFLSASPTIDSVEAYMRRVGAAADEASELDLRGLNTETCAICCAEIILGPQHAIAEMSIPPGERPAHFECGHALHADCFAVYTLSSGSACPVCKLERSSAPPPDDDDDEVRRAAAAAEYADEYADEYGGGEEGEGEGEDDEDWEEREERMLAARASAISSPRSSCRSRRRTRREAAPTTMVRF